MKKINVLAATAIVALGIAATSCDSKPSANLKSAVDSASYAIGVSTGAGYKENLKTLPGGEANIDALIEMCIRDRFCSPGGTGGVY